MLPSHDCEPSNPWWMELPRQDENGKIKRGQAILYSNFFLLCAQQDQMVPFYYWNLRLFPELVFGSELRISPPSEFAQSGFPSTNFRNFANWPYTLRDHDCESFIPSERQRSSYLKGFSSFGCGKFIEWRNCTWHHSPRISKASREQSFSRPSPKTDGTHNEFPALGDRASHFALLEPDQRIPSIHSTQLSEGLWPIHAVTFGRSKGWKTRVVFAVQLLETWGSKTEKCIIWREFPFPPRGNKKFHFPVFKVAEEICVPFRLFREFERCRI